MSVFGAVRFKPCRYCVNGRIFKDGKAIACTKCKGSGRK